MPSPSCDSRPLRRLAGPRFLLVALLMGSAVAGCDEILSLGRELIELSEIRIEPSGSVLLLGGNAHFQAVLIDNEGNDVPPGGRAPSVAWTTDDPDVVRVESAGMIEGAGAGVTRVRASAGGLEASAMVIVQPAADGVTVRENGRVLEGVVGSRVEDGAAIRIVDSSGEGVAGVTTQLWPGPQSGSVAPSMATTDADGFARTDWTLGLRAGAQHIDVTVPMPGSALGQPVNYSADLTEAASQKPTNPAGKLRGWAKPASPDEVTVEPSEATLAVGQTKQLQAEVKDRHGNVIPDADVTWTSLVPEVASVDEEGRVEGLAEGEAMIEASSGSAAGAASLAVVDQEPGSVKITPSEWSISGIGSTVQLTAEAKGPDGSPVPDAEFEWSSENPDIATVSQEGLVTARQIGSVAIIATLACASGCDDLIGTSNGQIDDENPQPPAQVTDLEANGSTATSITVTFTEVDDGTGSPANYALRYGSPTITWGSGSYPTEVVIEGTGIGNELEYEYNSLQPDTDYEFRLVSYRGTLNAGATFGELSNVAPASTESVEPGEPASVQVIPSNWTIRGVGSTLQLNAEARDSDGNTVPGASFEWSSGHPDIATVSSEGLVTAQAIGTVVIVATLACGASSCEGITDDSNGEVTESTVPPVDGAAFHDSFESGNNSHEENGFRWGSTSGSPDYRDEMEDGAQPLDGDWAHRFRNPANSQDNRLIQLRGPEVTEFWFEYWIRIPSNYDHSDTGGSGNNKWVEFFGGDRDQLLIWSETWRNSAGDGGSRLTLNAKGASGSSGHEGVTQNAVVVPDDLGNWQRWRFHGKITSTGSNSAETLLEVWINDTYVGSDTRGVDTPSSLHYFDRFQIMGWNNHEWPERITWYIDNVSIWTEDPGW